MKFASFKRRLLVAIPSYIMFVILFYIISGFLIINLEIGRGDMQVAPFVMMTMAILPLDFIVRLVMYPSAFGEDTITYIFLFVTMIVVETLYFTVIDMTAMSNSDNNIYLRDLSGNKPSPSKILIRSFLKAVSRILLLAPFISMIFSDKGQTLYDEMTEIVVLEKEDE